MMERWRAQLMSSALYSPRDFQPQPPQAQGQFGHIPGVPVGATWEKREGCYNAKVHNKRWAGISGTKMQGAYSIVLSGAYEDDVDEGETFVYTGTGGRAGSFGGASPQSGDQTFDHPDNMALQKSAETKVPVRVIRGVNPKSIYAPKEGYRYDGLYVVEEAWLDKGKSGYIVCKFRLRRVKDNQPPLPRL